MKTAEFREHQIKRTCTRHYQDYHRYLPSLLNDFSHRCCYCNISEEVLGTVSFQIDHFVPRKSFTGIHDQLLTQYNNLILSCPKCNRAKGGQYCGNISSGLVENELFYNPDEIDYNTIFYRNELGGISSDDPKGKEMIRRLKLYRPIHNYAWILDKLDKLITLLEQQIESEDDVRKKDLEVLKGKLALQYRMMQKQFVAAYHGKV